MLRGIRRKWKQPVYYGFIEGGTKKHDIAQIITTIVKKCQTIGLKVVATICDQGANNQAAINHLISKTKECYARKSQVFDEYVFEIDEQKVIPIYDIPHLFKGLRNNLLKNPLRFEENGEEKIAKWEHIYMAYKMDPYLGNLRLMPKITDRHVDPEKVNKMKVSCCTQVFSHSVAAAINVFAFSGNNLQYNSFKILIIHLHFIYILFYSRYNSLHRGRCDDHGKVSS